MRAVALILIILSEIVLALTRNTTMNGSGLSFMTTLIVVVVVAFALSGFLQRFASNLALARNYTSAGIIGVIVGVLYYIWVKDHIPAMIDWLSFWGMYILLGVILLSALFLFMMPKKIIEVVD